MNIIGHYASPANIMGAKQTLLDKNKGSMGNRIDCVKEQTINTFKTTSKGVAASVAIGAGSGLAVTSKSINNLVDKGIQAAKKFVSNNDTLKELLPQIKKGVVNLAAKVKNLPTSGKVILAAASGLTAITGYVIDKTHSFKAGQIDQKYNDKAQLQNTLEQK